MAMKNLLKKKLKNLSAVNSKQHLRAIMHKLRAGTLHKLECNSRIEMMPTTFFSFYGFLAGFEVATTHTTRTANRKRHGEIVKVEMRCHRHGKGQITEKMEKEEAAPDINAVSEKGPKRSTDVQVRTNCQVVMVVKEENGVWTIVRLDLDHNHELSPGNRNQIFSGRKYMSDAEKALIRTLNHNNVPTRQMIAILSYLRDGILALPYKAKDVANYRTKINREVTGNDMSRALDYFRQRK